MIWKVAVSQWPDLHYDDPDQWEGTLVTRHSVSAVFALTGLAAIWAVGAPAYGAEEQTSQKPGVQQNDKSQEDCIARRQREGLNIRFAVKRCVNPNN